MRVTDINRDLVERFAEIKGLGEVFDRGKEDLTAYFIGAVRAVIRKGAGDAEKSVRFSQAKKIPESNTPTRTPIARL